VPGQTNPLVVTPNRTGTYPVICTELCGLGHSLMRSHVTIVPAAKFDSWLKAGSSTGSAASGSGSGSGSSAGLAVFQANGCASCHTFTPAGASGKIGPDLDKLKEEAPKAGDANLVAFIKQSIVDPNAYIAPGFQANLMPSIFGQLIPAPKLNDLVQYLATNTK
jgi:cytochrome c oxidase subunit 2